MLTASVTQCHIDSVNRQRERDSVTKTYSERESSTDLENTSHCRYSKLLVAAGVTV